MPERTPWGLPFRPEAVPKALIPYPRWVVWMAAFTRPGKVDKHPRRAWDPTQSASTKDREQWGNFHDACKHAQPPYAGVGFVLTQDPNTPTLEHLAAIDLDHCRNPDTGEINAQAQTIVDALKGTYWEASPSGTGLRGFFIGRLPGPSIANHDAHVEIYNGDTARYVTVTGQHLEGTGVDVAAVNPLAIANLFEQFAATGKSGTVTVYADMPEIVDDVTAQGYTRTAIDALPQRLGDFLEHGTVDGYASRSEAAYACCIALYGAGYSDIEVFSALHGSPYVWAMALDHRNQKEHRALAYLWAECCRARARAAPEPLEFDDISQTNTSQTNTPSAPPASPIFSPTVWHGTKSTPRDWIVDGYFPRREVTLFMGGGGVGKSLLALQLQTAMALGAHWLGLPTLQGRSLGIYCEDKADELQRRQEAINGYYMAEHSDLGDMLLWPRSTTDGSLLMTFENKDQGARTKFTHELVKQVRLAKPDLLILDTLSDFFGGNENSRGQVTQFCRLLSHIAQGLNIAIVVCGHPSAAGTTSGEGTSGSTAWNNAVRSRLYLHREKADDNVELNTNIRILSKQKSNYSTTGDQTRLVYVDGAFRHEREPSAESFFQSADTEAETTFTDLMREFEATDKWVSASKHGRYGPREFAKRMGGGAEAEKRWYARFEAAMHRLLKAKTIVESAVRFGRSAQLVFTESSK